jgi:hypothetical protein
VPAQCLDALAAAGACLSDVRHSTSEPAHTPVPTEQRVAVIGHPDSCRARDEPGACDALLSACCVGYAVSALSRLACACLRAAGGRRTWTFAYDKVVLNGRRVCSFPSAFSSRGPMHADQTSRQCVDPSNSRIQSAAVQYRP